MLNGLKGANMSNHNVDDRVLSRMGARVLTSQEMDQVGGSFGTGICTYDPKTGFFDHDCSPPPG